VTDRDEAVRRRTPQGLDRVVFFSDAVVAIAISLLILPVVDEVGAAKAAGNLTGFDFFADNGGRLLAFAISFLVIASFWRGHHGLFETVKDYTSALVWVNLLWLATIVFLPLPTEILAVDDAQDYGARAIYIGSVFLVSATTVALEFIVDRTPSIQRWPEDRRPKPIARLVVPASILVALALAAIPAIGMWSLLLLAVSGRIADRLGDDD
jgi:uncharacterized membrane protein